MAELNYLEKQNLEKKKRGIRNNNLKKKLGEKCVYCGCDNVLILTIDHIKPIVRGGEDTDENKQVACFTCNQIKDALNDKEFKDYMKALSILKKLNKVKIDFNNKGQPTILFNEKGHPSTLKEIEEKYKKETEEKPNEEKDGI